MRHVVDARAYARIAARNAAVNEVAHDQTRQRAFERSFESRDLPNSRAAIADTTDGGLGAAHIRALGGRGASWYEERIRSAASHLPKPLWHLRRLLLNIYFCRGDRLGTKAATWPEEDPRSHATTQKYWEGVKKLSNFFRVPENIGSNAYFSFEN